MNTNKGKQFLWSADVEDKVVEGGKVNLLTILEIWEFTKAILDEKFNYGKRIRLYKKLYLSHDILSQLLINIFMTFRVKCYQAILISKQN